MQILQRLVARMFAGIAVASWKLKYTERAREQ